MSIATLKKKTLAKYNNMSVGSPDGFSLNGTHRNQGYIGQTSLSRFLSRTTMRGTTPKGYGGCCGTYRQTPIVSSAVTSQENSNVVKKSSLNNKGMLDTRYRWARRPYPFSSTKPGNNIHLNTQGQHIENKKKCTILNTEIYVPDTINPPSVGCDNIPVAAKPRINRLNRSCYSYTKPLQATRQSNDLPYSTKERNYENYLTELNKKCRELDDFHIPSNIRRSPNNIYSG
jgi:hypothetical protein